MNFRSLYIMALRVSQPARIQEIQGTMKLLREELRLPEFSSEEVQEFHEIMRKEKLVFSVKRGVYWLSPGAQSMIDSDKMLRYLDGKRLLLMRNERKSKR